MTRRSGTAWPSSTPPDPPLHRPRWTPHDGPTMMLPMSTAPALIGRGRELETIHHLAAGVHAGGSSLIVHGAPGVGKSALLDAAAGRLSGEGWCVLRTEGTPAERRLPFAGLQKLLRPVMRDAGALYAPQQNALLRAFGLVDGPAAGIFLVALATLDLLAEAAASAPVLVVVEDTQWLDRCTADVLAFVARRLAFDPILLLASGRGAEDDPLSDAGLPELPLSALDRDASEALLDASAPGLSASRRRIVLGAAVGNPLALVELPKALDDDVDPTHAGGQLPMTERLERAFALRASEMRPAAVDLALLAALHDSDSLSELLGAAARMRPGAGVDGLGIATSAGLVAIEGSSVRFRHPLVRSAISRSASPARRQAAHAALAEVLSDEPNRSVGTARPPRSGRTRGWPASLRPWPGRRTAAVRSTPRSPPCAAPPSSAASRRAGADGSSVRPS